MGCGGARLPQHLWTDRGGRLSAALEITFITPSFTGAGGTDAWVVEVATRLAQRHSVEVWCRDTDVTGRQPYRVRRVPSLGRPFPALARYISFVAAASLRLRRQGSRRDLLRVATGGDCVGVDLMVANYCQAARLELVRRGVILVEGKSGMPLLEKMSQHAYMRIVAACERWVYNPSRVRRVAAVSEGIAADLCHFYGVSRDRIHVIPNGTDADRTRALVAAAPHEVRADHGIPPTAFVLCFVGGDWGRKGLRHAIRAVGLLQDPGVWLIVAGRGDQEHYSRLAAECGVADRVLFVGHVPPTAYLLAADLFILPSAYEGLPIATLEAADIGVPLLVTPCNGHADLIRDGENGFFTAADPVSIASAIRRLQQDEPSRMAAAEAMKVSLASRFTWDQVAVSAEHLLGDLVAADAS
jgi:glycosyltransferase involved in cell wall biosynthesis